MAVSLKADELFFRSDGGAIFPYSQLLGGAEAPLTEDDGHRNQIRTVWHNLGRMMPTGNPHFPVTKPPKRLRFDRYVLDLDRGCLLRDGNEIALRPKTFLILEYLAENSGRLVAKHELFAAVWPDLAVTDDVLVQSIGELRRAFGDQEPRLIRTIPRRGYRFETDVTTIDPVNRSVTDDVASPSIPLPDAQRSPQQIIGAARAFVWWTRASTGARVGILAPLALVFLLAAAGLWSVDRALTKTAGPGPRPAIAFLPLVDQGDDTAHGYFADGLTQDIINALGRFSALTVMSWNAVSRYNGTVANPQEVGRNLAVSYLVEGNIAQIGDRVRVVAQLVDTAQGRVLWSARFDEALADVFALQDKITTELVRALAIQVSQIEQRRVFAKPTGNLEAYDYVLRARPALRHPTRESNVEARTLLKRAIDLDPNYAGAYAALAETYYTDTSMGWAESPSDSLGRAEELALDALSLDVSEVRAHIVLARIDILHQSYQRAEQETDLAIAINPNDAESLAGRGNVLMWLGETDAAIDALEQAQRIDPDLNAIDRFALSLAYYLKGRYGAAIEQAELNLRDTSGSNVSLIVLAAAYAQQRRADDAARVAAMIRRLDPTFDPRGFGTKFLSAADLEHLRDGLRAAGLSSASVDSPTTDR